MLARTHLIPAVVIVAGPRTMDVSLNVTPGQLVGSVVGSAIAISSGSGAFVAATRAAVIVNIVTNSIDGIDPSRTISFPVSASNPPSPSTEPTDFSWNNLKYCADFAWNNLNYCADFAWNNLNYCSDFAWNSQRDFDITTSLMRSAFDPSALPCGSAVQITNMSMPGQGAIVVFFEKILLWCGVESQYLIAPVDPIALKYATLHQLLLILLVLVVFLIVLYVLSVTFNLYQHFFLGKLEQYNLIPKNYYVLRRIKLLLNLRHKRALIVLPVIILHSLYTMFKALLYLCNHPFN